MMRQPAEWYRLRRLEQKVDLILKHLGIEYRDTMADLLTERVRALADDPSKKINAIKLHRQETGCGLKEAKDAIEAYIAGRSG
jgi:ribosomal protein L7/L12